EKKKNLESAMGPAKTSFISQIVQSLDKKIDLQDAEFDDLKYWIQLPIPANAIPDSQRKAIQNEKTDAWLRKQIFAKYIFQHWIQRQSRVRCELYSECLSPVQKKRYYNSILAMMYADEQAARLITEKILPKNQIKNYQRALTIAACTKVIITNSKSAMA